MPPGWLTASEISLLGGSEDVWELPRYVDGDTNIRYYQVSPAMLAQWQERTGSHFYSRLGYDDASL